jgi:hypothetical protein
MSTENKYLKSTFRTPILFLVFNRPNLTKKVFDKIKQSKTPRLYLACDGPRAEIADDEVKIKKVKKIISQIDWPCKVKTLFRDKNFGCKKAVGDAITWFFEHEKQGIILEDDCLPNLNFFRFCENLLFYYSKNTRVSVISGNNFQNGNWRGKGSYYFSKYPHIWGWATWRRAWKNYQKEIAFWPKWKKSSTWIKLNYDKHERKYWEKIFQDVYMKKINSWAYPWVASIWYKNGLTVTPNVNLVANIGFGKDATHTRKKNKHESSVRTQSLNSIVHPKSVKVDLDADIYDFHWTFGGKNLKFPGSWIILPFRVYKFIFKFVKKIFN